MMDETSRETESGGEEEGRHGDDQRGPATKAHGMEERRQEPGLQSPQ